MQWNAQGISNFCAIAQLSQFINNENVDILLLSETLLKSHHKFYLNKFKVYRNDRSSDRGGGVAIAVRAGIKHKLLAEINAKSIENISIAVEINGRNVIFTSTYCPKYQPSFKKDIEKLTNFDLDFFIAGDFNAHNIAWNCAKNNSAGNVLNNLQLTSEILIYYPNSPTHYPSSGTTPSTIDLILTNSDLNVSQPITYDCSLMSDHTPIIFNIGTCSIERTVNKVFNFKEANWKTFQEYLDDYINPHTDFSLSDASPSTIDDSIKKIYETIQEAKNRAVPLVEKQNHDFYELSSETKACIKHRNILKRNWQRSRDSYLKPILKRMLNQYNRFVSIKVTNDRNTNWNNTLSKFEGGDRHFWRISKILKGNKSKRIEKLLVGDKYIVTNEEKANALADNFEQNHMLTSTYFHSIEHKVKRLCRSISSDTRENLNGSTYTTPNEIETIIKGLKNRKAPGMDGIQNVLLKNLSKKSVILLTKIFNGCIKIGYFPTQFKCAKVIPILKSGKDPKRPLSYRPISLLSSLGKILERVILKRLTKFAEETNILAKEQFGFRSEHSTTHQIQRVTKIVTHNRAHRKSTGMVLLDIEKAYDTVWHDGLIYKLNSFDCPFYLTKMLHSFLANRSFFVSVNNYSSSTRSIPAGLPQGSVISPLLYSIFISDFKKPKYCEIAYYADDTSLLCSGKQTKTIIKKLQMSLHAVQKYLKKWKIKLNDGKTQAILFPFNRSPKRTPRTNLRFNNNEIIFSNHCKYLGVILDQKLNFAKHIETARNKGINCLRTLYSLIGRKSKLSYENKNLIYKMVIRPTMTYASPVWKNAAKTHIKKIQVVQNKCLKMINNLPWRYSTIDLHQRTDYKTINELIDSHTTRFFDKCRQSNYQLIQELV